MSQTIFWNFSEDGITTSSNEVGVVGTSNYVAASVNIYLGGVLQGTTTTDGSGGWKYILPAVADGGPYSVTASMTSGPSSLSNTRTYSVGIQITNFTNVPGSAFNIGSGSWTVQSAAVSYNISRPDTHTLRFEVRSGERLSGDATTIERSEIRDNLVFAQGTTYNVVYQFLHEVGTANIAGQRLTHMELRNLDVDMPAGKTATNNVIDIGILAERLSLGVRFCPTTLNPGSQATSLTPYTSATNIVRGQRYRVEIEMLVMNDATGFCRIWLDGIQIVNYSGSIGYGPYRNYWRAGLIRNSQVNTQSLSIKNFIRSSTGGVAYSGNYDLPSSNLGLVANFSTTSGSTAMTIGGQATKNLNRNAPGPTAWTIQNPDSYSLRYEVRSGDLAQSVGGGWVDSSTSERSETELMPRYGSGVTINISYKFTLHAGSTNTSQWVIIGQLHFDLGSGSPPFSIALFGEKMTVICRGPTNFENRVYQDPVNIQRDHQYVMLAQVFLNGNGTGTCKVWRDGIQIVNFSGALGSGVSGDTHYFKQGVYRNEAAEALAATYTNTSVTTV